MKKLRAYPRNSVYTLGYLKRISAGIIIAATLLSPVSQIYAAETKKEVSADIDGKCLPFDQPPILENGRALVPMRVIIEVLGAKVEWLHRI